MWTLFHEPVYGMLSNIDILLLWQFAKWSLQRHLYITIRSSYETWQWIRKRYQNYVRFVKLKCFCININMQIASRQFESILFVQMPYSWYVAHLIAMFNFSFKGWGRWPVIPVRYICSSVGLCWGVLTRMPSTRRSQRLAAVSWQPDLQGSSGCQYPAPDFCRQTKWRLSKNQNNFEIYKSLLLFYYGTNYTTEKDKRVKKANNTVITYGFGDFKREIDNHYEKNWEKIVTLYKCHKSIVCP